MATWIALSNYNKGWAYDKKSNFVKSIAAYQQAIDVYTEIGAHSKSATVLYTMGQLFHKQGELVKTIEYFTLSLADWKEVGNQEISFISQMH